MKLVCFCEAAADFQLASGLVDRVLHDDGPRWVADLMEADTTRDSVRAWVPDGARSFFKLGELAGQMRSRGLLAQQGRFGGEVGAADARMARNALRVAGHIHKDEELAAVVLVRDMDQDGPNRRKGLSQARDTARAGATFAIVLGCADPMREAWVLAGFEPSDEAERALVEDARRELGFHPCEEAHQLDAQNETAKKNAKRVLASLTRADPEREERCWTEAPLDRLRARGQRSGLAEFLDEIREHLLPK